MAEVTNKRYYEGWTRGGKRIRRPNRGGRIKFTGKHTGTPAEQADDIEIEKRTNVLWEKAVKELKLKPDLYPVSTLDAMKNRIRSRVKKNVTSKRQSKLTYEALKASTWFLPASLASKLAIKGGTILGKKVGSALKSAEKVAAPVIKKADKLKTSVVGTKTTKSLAERRAAAAKKATQERAKQKLEAEAARKAKAEAAKRLKEQGLKKAAAEKLKNLGRKLPGGSKAKAAKKAAAASAAAGAAKLAAKKAAQKAAAKKAKETARKLPVVKAATATLPAVGRQIIKRHGGRINNQGKIVGLSPVGKKALIAAGIVLGGGYFLTKDSKEKKNGKPVSAAQPPKKPIVNREKKKKRKKEPKKEKIYSIWGALTDPDQTPGKRKVKLPWGGTTVFDSESPLTGKDDEYFKGGSVKYRGWGAARRPNK